MKNSEEACLMSAITGFQGKDLPKLIDAVLRKKTEEGAFNDPSISRVYQEILRGLFTPDQVNKCIPTVANALKFQDFERLAMCIIRMYELMDRILDILRHSQKEKQEDLFTRLAQNILDKVANSLNDKFYYKMDVCRAIDDLFFDLEGILADQEAIRPELERQSIQKSQFMKSALQEKKMIDRKTLDCGVLNLSEMTGLGMRRLIAKTTDLDRMVFDPINFETCLREMMKRAVERPDIYNDKYLFYYINDKRRSSGSDFFKIILLEINQSMQAQKSEIIHIEGTPTSSERSALLYEQYYIEPSPKSTLKIDPSFSNAIEVKFEDDVAVYDLQSKLVLAIFQIVYKSFILDKLPSDYFRKYEGDVPQVIITTDTLYEFLNFLKGRPIGTFGDQSKMKYLESTLSRNPGSLDRQDDYRYINTSEVHRGVLDLFGSQVGNKYNTQYQSQIPAAFVESFKVTQNMSAIPQSFLQSAIEANQKKHDPTQNQGMRQGLANYIKSNAGDSIGDKARRDAEDHERQRAENIERMKKEQLERQEKERQSREARELELRTRAEAEKEKQEKERKEREAAREKARLEREEKDRIAREEKEKRDREANERREAKEREDNERKEREKREREEKEKVRLEKEEKERQQAKERIEKEKQERELREQAAREQQEKLRKEREERIENERKEKEEKDRKDRERREQEEKERRERDAQEKAKRDEADRIAREKREKEDKERKERLEKENQERLDREKAEREQKEIEDRERKLQEQKDRERRQQEEDEQRRKLEETRENERKERERQEQLDREKREREEKERFEKEERERKEREAQALREKEEQDRKEEELRKKEADEKIKQELQKKLKEEEDDRIKKENAAKAAVEQHDDGFDDFDDFGNIDDMDDFGASTDKKKQPESSKKIATPPQEAKPTHIVTAKPRTQGDEEIEFDDDDFGDMDDLDDFGESVGKKKVAEKPPSKPITPPPETQPVKAAPEQVKKDATKKNAQADEEFDFNDDDYDFLNDDLEDSKPKKEEKKLDNPTTSQPKGIVSKPTESPQQKPDIHQIVHDNPRGDPKVLKSEHLEVIDRYVTGTSPLEADEVQDFMASLSLDHNTVSMIFNEFISNQTVFLLDFQESNEFLRIWIEALENDGKQIDLGSINQLGRMIGQLLKGTFEGQSYDKIKYFCAPFMVVNPVANEMLVHAVIDLKNKKVLLISLNPEIDENIARTESTDLSFLMIANIMAKCLNVAMGDTDNIEITKENLFMPLLGVEFMEFLAESCDARLPEGEEEPENPEQAYPYLRYMMINYLIFYENSTDRLDIEGFKESLTLETFDLMNALRFVSTMRAATESLKLRTQMQHMPELANGLLQTAEIIKQEKMIDILPKLAEEVTLPSKLADTVKADLEMLKESRQENSKVFTVLEYLFNEEGDQKVVIFMALQNNEPDVVMYLSENTEPYNTQCLDLLKPALKRDSGKEPSIFIENPRHTFATDRIDLFCCTWAILVVEVQLSAVNALRCLMYNELPFVNELMQGLMAGEEEGEVNPNDIPLGMENSDERGVVEDQAGQGTDRDGDGDEDFGFDDDFDADFDDEKPKAGGAKKPTSALPTLKTSTKAPAEVPKGKQSNINYNADDDLDDFEFDQADQGQAGGDDFDDLDF
jgi:hypothetical protein